MVNPKKGTVVRSSSFTSGRKKAMVFLVALISCAVFANVLIDDSDVSSADDSAGSIFDVDGVEYKVISDSNVEIVDISDDLSALTINSTVTNTTWEWYHWVSKTYNITSAADDAFVYGESLTSITVSGNTNFSSADGILYNSSGSELLCYPMAKAGTSYSIPTTVSGIGPYAFCGCDNLETVTIGSNVNSMGDYAFYNCENIETVTIGSGLTTIGNYAFYDCNDMGTLIVDSNITTIGSYAFYECEDLYTAKIGSDVVLETGMVKISPSVTMIGSYSFSECDKIQNLQIGVPIGTSAITIGDNAFYDCDDLTNVVMGCSVQIIGDDSFHNCVSLKAVVIPTSVSKIGSHAFISTSLKAVAIPSTTNVSSSAFDLTLLGGPWEIYYGGDHIMAAVLSCGSTYDLGSDNHYTLTVVPETGYGINSYVYTGDSSDISRVGDTNVWNISSGSMSAGGHKVTFTTGVLSYNITTSVQNGTISPSVTLNYGGSATIAYSSSIGYHLVSVIVDGVLVTGHDSSYTFNNVTANHTISVVYSVDTYVVTLDKDAHVSNISYSLNDGALQNYTVPLSLKYGDKLSIVATTDPGYHFVQWATGVTANPLVIASVNANINYVATSSIDTFTVTLNKDANISSIVYTLNGGTTQTYVSPISVSHGDNLNLYATSGTGYHFVQWATGVTDNPLTIHDVTANITYTATSSIDTFTVTLNKDAHVSSMAYTLNGSSHNYTVPFTVNYGDVLILTASLDTGYFFVQWATGVTANPLTISSVNSNINYTATSSKEVLTVTLNKDDHISGITYTVNGGASQTYTAQFTVNYGDDLKITASVDPGYNFIQWAPGVTSNPLTITDVTSNISYTAISHVENLTITVSKDAHVSSITYTVNGGASQTYIAPFTVDYGDNVLITANMETGYYFLAWSGTIVSTTNPLPINVVTDVNISATSSMHVFTISLDKDAHVSSITYKVNGGASQTYTAPFNVSYGTSLQITANMNAGYHFTSWSGTIVSTVNPLTISSVDSNVNITASSSIDVFTVTLSKDAHISNITYTLNGGTSKNYTVPFTVNYGDNLTIKAVADSGYYFVQWASGVTDNPLTITDITSNISYTATSSMDAFTVTLSKDSNISGITYTLNGGVPQNYTVPFAVDYGDDLTVTAIMNFGYNFNTWSGTITSTDNPLSIDLVSNVSLIASASPDTSTVTFVGNYSESTYSVSITETYGTAYVLPEDDPTRDGYNFAGWYTSSTGGTQVTSQTVVYTTGDKTLYAHWTAHSGGNVDIGKIIPWLIALFAILVIAAYLINRYLIGKRKYKVMFDANGGTGKMKDQSFMFDSSQGISNNAFTRPGYAFMGWSTTPTGSVIYSNGQSVENLIPVGEKSITLYAVWEPGN
ncbi:MAG: leucine-rich repeat protein [Candidatus Methanogranum gryphiswaldense]|nr:MAG: leucine-rich repeat protein [Candidatus Methanogranum sp. U3.2.1]